MKRTFNYTGRKKIARDNIALSIVDRPDGRLVNIERIDLSGLSGFSGEEKVYVEAYYERSWMRFDLGSVNSPDVPIEKHLDDLDGTDLVYFRVKVVDESGEVGKIVAMADKISVSAKGDDENKESILPVNYRDLGNEVWRLAWEEIGPVLEVNNRIPEIEHFVKTNPVFQGLVLPEILRSILYRVLVNDLCKDEEEDHWTFKWIKFAETLSGSTKPQDFDDEDIDDWIFNVIDSFSRIHKFVENLSNVLSDESE